MEDRPESSGVVEVNSVVPVDTEKLEVATHGERRQILWKEGLSGAQCVSPGQRPIGLLPLLRIEDRLPAHRQKRLQHELPRVQQKNDAAFLPVIETGLVVDL